MNTEADVQELKNFEIGDYIVFERVFTQDDFASFSALSGDRNPLHHDVDFAASTTLGTPIVPLHLTLAPMSMIAGMVFPGDPSLYLGHEVRAAKPVPYGVAVRYSAKIETINESHRMLGLRVLALIGADVVLDASMRVQVRADVRSSRSPIQIRKGKQPSTALVTGASGEIGLEVARALAVRGWRLLLQDRGRIDVRERMQAYLGRETVGAQFVKADLATADGRSILAQSITDQDELGLVVHAASPDITAPLQELVDVNFTALASIVDAAIPKMLDRQSGAVVLIGSKAAELSLRGWEHYSGAKTMAHALINGIERRSSGYGVRGLTISPGLVTTRFSKAFRGSAPALLPGEVAEALIQFVETSDAHSNVLMIEPGYRRRGRIGFHSSERGAATLPAAGPQVVRAPAAASVVGESSPTDAMAKIFRQTLRMPDEADLSDAALGVTPNWDSLRHIELLLKLEAGFGIRFQSKEMENLQRFADICAACVRKLGESAS